MLIFNAIELFISQNYHRGALEVRLPLTGKTNAMMWSK